MKTINKVACAAAGLAILLAGCGPKEQPVAATPPPPSQASEQWETVANRFIEEYFVAQPAFAAGSGRHEFDGQLPDVSAAGIQRETSRLHEARQRIEAVDPQPLKERERFDREYLLSVVDRDLFWMEKAHSPATNPAWYLGVIDPDMYLNRDYAPLEVRMKAYIQYARGIPQMAADIQENLQGPLPKTYVELGIAGFGGFVDFYLKDVAPVFASVPDPELQTELTDADKNAAAAMGHLRDHLIGLRKTANDQFALGADLFAAMLEDTERVDIPVADIEAAGRADLDRNTEALKKECLVYLPKGSITACIAKVAADKPAAGPVAAARVQLEELKKFVQDHDIVSIPSPEQAKVAEAPPYDRSNSAFIQVPGPFDKGVTATYNISPPDPHWSKADQRAYIPSVATLLFTSVHEAWPGHFLQFLHSNANPDKLEALWVGYAFAEGWAHYTEEMMVAEGLTQGDPGKHIGQLMDALLRDVRLLSAIGLHTHGLTVAQSERMFKDLAFQDPGNARQQAARGTYDPAYLNYTLGKLMIRKLRADWLAKNFPSAAGIGDRSHWLDFHDVFLSFGGPPIPLLRRQLLGDAGSLL